VGWLVNGGRVRWMRAAGALAGLTLVTYIGMRGFRPSELREEPTIPPSIVEVSPQIQAVPDEREVTQGQPDAVVVPPDAASKSEADASPTPPSAVAPVPNDTQPFGRADEVSVPLQKPPGTLAIEPQSPAVAERAEVQSEEPQLGLDRVGAAQPPAATPTLGLQVRGGRSNEVKFPIPPAIDFKKSALEEPVAFRVQDRAADSLASYLALALRDDPARARESATGRAEAPRVKQLNQSKPGVAATQPPVTGEVDRLLQLADLAQHYEADATIRPHLETIALRLANYAPQDPRAAARARTLMRTLAASSATTSERADWEERLRQLPP
jgi:hypothetical protein